MFATYSNPWHTAYSLDPKTYQTGVKPVEYRGFLIYQRLKGVCFDVVKNDICIAQRAGLNGAKRQIDTILDDPTDFWAVRSLSYLV